MHLLARARGLAESFATRMRGHAKRRALSRAERPVALFLSPEAGLKPYFASHLLLAKTLEESGYGALILSCDGILPICSWKFASRILQTDPDDKENWACTTCREERERAKLTYDVPQILLEEIVTAADRQRIRRLIAANKDRLTPVEVDGVAVGKLAVAEVLRSNRKTSYEDFSGEDHRLTEAVLYSTLIVHCAVKKLVATGGLGRAAFFGDYAYWIAAQITFKKHGIPALRINHTYNRDYDRRVIGFHPNSANTHLLDQQA